MSVASSDDLGTAIEHAIEATESDLAGATLAVNASMEGADIAKIDSIRFATFVAPSFLNRESLPEIRLLESREGLGYEALQELRSVVGGVLIQDRNRSAVNPFSWRIPSANQPLVTDWETMIFGVRISRHLRSISCLALKGERIIAQASGLSHQWRFRQRLREDEKSLVDSILVFDEDIEDPDLLSEVKELGVTVVVHPGTANSREGELVDRANQLGLVLVITGVSFTNF